MKAQFGCNLMLGKSFTKWRQRPAITIADEWDANHQFKQAKKVNVFHPESDKKSNAYYSGCDRVSVTRFIPM